MNQKLTYRKETPSQTAGPYVHIGLAPGAAGFAIYERELGADIAGPHARGERIRLEGLVTDGAGAPVKDVLLEAWQANADGVYPDPANPGAVEAGFRGWGRVITDFDSGAWAFDTIKPGSVMGRDGAPMAPHICLWLVARGINIGLHTRIYFSDEAAANAADPVLRLVEQEHRRETLIARRLHGADGAGLYRFEVRLQGADETVFFDV